MADRVQGGRERSRQPLELPRFFPCLQPQACSTVAALCPSAPAPAPAPLPGASPFLFQVPTGSRLRLLPPRVGPTSTGTAKIPRCAPAPCSCMTRSGRVPPRGRAGAHAWHRWAHAWDQQNHGTCVCHCRRQPGPAILSPRCPPSWRLAAATGAPPGNIKDGPHGAHPRSGRARCPPRGTAPCAPGGRGDRAAAGQAPPLPEQMRSGRGGGCLPPVTATERGGTGSPGCCPGRLGTALCLQPRG